jgi:two-component system, cell cycle response regulator
MGGKAMAKGGFPLTEKQDFASVFTPLEEASRRMKKPTILVVDDELFFRRLYAEILNEEDYVIQTASSGEEAIARLEEGEVDIVLTDMVMPGIDGLELLRRARSLDSPPEVILSTGHATVESAIHALKNGARDYLVKPFNPEELRHLIRICLEQRRLLDENSLLHKQIRLFLRGQNLAFLLEIERLLPEAVNLLRHEMGQGRGFAFLLGKNRVPRIFGMQGVDQSSAKSMIRALSPHVKGLSDGYRVLYRDELQPETDWPENIHAVLLCPLRCQKSLKGAIIIMNAAEADSSPAIPSDNLTFLSEQATLGFENAYRYQGARELVYADDLTGLYNHRYLQMILDQEINRAQRYKLEFSVVFIDLDHFKDVNDTYGHLAGSKALKEVAMLLRKSVREVDVLFRYGGDEFTALLVETDSRGAAIVAERFRTSIEEHVFLSAAGMPSRLTATVGYATFPKDASDKQGIIDLADRAMYEGKNIRNVSRGAWEIKKN